MYGAECKEMEGLHGVAKDSKSPRISQNFFAMHQILAPNEYCCIINIDLRFHNILFGINYKITGMIDLDCIRALRQTTRLHKRKKKWGKQKKYIYKAKKRNERRLELENSQWVVFIPLGSIMMLLAPTVIYTTGLTTHPMLYKQILLKLIHILIIKLY